jgi:PAS domain S-box-containing protein
MMLTSWYGGDGAGFLASVVAMPVFLLSAILNTYSIVSWGALLLLTLLVGWLEKKRRKAIEISTQAQAALSRNELDLLGFFENAPVALHWVDPDGYILRANRAELKMLGYASEEYLGHHISEFHADEAVIGNILRRLAAGETLHDQEARLICRGGSIRHALISANVLWENGRFVHTRCFTRDITELVQASQERAQLLAREQAARAYAEAAELRFRDLVNSVDAIVWEADVKPFRFAFVSQRAQQILGYPVERWLAASEPSPCGGTRPRRDRITTSNTVWLHPMAAFCGCTTLFP